VQILEGFLTIGLNLSSSLFANVSPQTSTGVDKLPSAFLCEKGVLLDVRERSELPQYQL
jgi:hypothetical protein